MSLTGNLEDLPLLDILQIVSFSKKTGYLTIRAEEGEGGIVFLDGLVVAAFTWDSLPVEPRVATLSEGARGKAIRSRIEIALEQLIRLREGQFNFSLTAGPPKVVGQRDITLETLDYGINPQELLLELARGMDEDRRDSTAAVEASFAQPEERGRGPPPTTPRPARSWPCTRPRPRCPIPRTTRKGPPSPSPPFDCRRLRRERGGAAPESRPVPAREAARPDPDDPARRRRGRHPEAPGRPLSCRRLRRGRSRRPRGRGEAGGPARPGEDRHSCSWPTSACRLRGERPSRAASRW